MSNDINDRMPKLPPNSWGAVMDWIPSKVEIDDFVLNSPFSYNSKWHTINRSPTKDGLIIDGKEIKNVSSKRLT